MRMNVVQTVDEGNQRDGLMKFAAIAEQTRAMAMAMARVEAAAATALGAATLTANLKLTTASSSSVQFSSPQVLCYFFSESFANWKRCSVLIRRREFASQFYWPGVRFHAI
jgi:hypothetical protein